MKPYTEKELLEMVKSAKKVDELSFISNHVFEYRKLYDSIYIRIQSACIDKVRTF